MSSGSRTRKPEGWVGKRIDSVWDTCLSLSLSRFMITFSITFYSFWKRKRDIQLAAAGTDDQRAHTHTHIDNIVCLLLIRSLEGVWTHQTQKVEGRRGGWDRWKIHDGFDPFRAAAAFHFRSLGLRPTKRPQPNPTARNQSPTRTKLKRTQQTKRNTREEEKKKKKKKKSLIHVIRVCASTRSLPPAFPPPRMEANERTNEQCECVSAPVYARRWNLNIEETSGWWRMMEGPTAEFF